MERYYYLNDDDDDADNLDIWISDLEKYKIRQINRLLNLCDDDKKCKDGIIYKYSVCCESRYIKSLIEYLERFGYVKMIKTI